ncbi:oxygen-independent coproporphyrinogen-III oxidase 1 [Mariprofundus micogutta]|uniref:Oxygen-independent coproporphyrinogen-III oxidase 1 n=1 Tax=Mariprofundus micogutta TaxID=1921010 RepID=A0A1L8CLQ4_9PROT|nr:radical SAM protein [Mariprofundus micogutta]GAV19833.1 oxygen-independent coproporphyrinogen-III oxidase 1 [Mariprofundus micogutta]
MTIAYHMPLYRPPSEADNLIIQVTLGCSFNQCSFCSMYRSKQYRQRPLADVVNEIAKAARSWPDARRVFLADGDALNLPTAQWLAILEALHAALPNLSRVSCYATPANLLAKSHEELQLLKASGLSLLYLGIESGSNLILKKITKGASQRGIAKAMQNAFDAGLKVSGTVILGLGGKQHWQEHIDATIELLNQAPLTYLSTLQLYLEEDVMAEFQTRFGEPFEIPDDRAMLLEQMRLLEGLNPPKAVIFRSNHASNALALAGNLPRDREKLLNQLYHALKGETPLRPWYMRAM